MWGLSLGVCGEHFLSELIHHNLAFQIPDFDARSCGGTQPVSVGAEAQGVNDVASVQCVQVLAFIQVPEHGLSVLATRSTQ